MKFGRTFFVTIGALAVVFITPLIVVPAQIEKDQNHVIDHIPYQGSADAQALHKTLVIGDLHTDSTLWGRDLSQRSQYGHVDLPRLREGNVALQMFTTVTKSPRGQNYQQNNAEADDNITLLAVAQAWPTRTWGNLTERALYQAKRLHKLSAEHSGQLVIIRSQGDLESLIKQRQQGKTVIGGLIGTEGSHALEGDLDNIKKLFEAGFRMMSLQHFFDNQLGGSLHGESGAGLTEFGRQAVDEMLRLGVMIDVSHSATQVVEDVLARSDKPLIVSHTGFYGHCPNHRNISDKLMQRIAEQGGLIGVGYWDGAVCDPTPRNIVQAIRYGIELVGIDHVALGSDFDGAVTTHFDTSELVVLTDEMLQAGFSEAEIRQVMGENMLRFLSHQLPP